MQKYMYVRVQIAGKTGTNRAAKDPDINKN